MKKTIVLSCALFSSLLLAGDKIAYSTTVKPMYVDKTSTKVAGKLLPTSKVTILEKVGDRLHVKVDGFMVEGSDGAVYYGVGKRILVAGIANNSGIKFEKTKSHLDKDTGKKYFEASFKAYIDDKNLADDVKPLFLEAEKKYKETCSMCHSLHPVDEFTANQWPSMVKSMASRAGLDNESRYFMVEYLQKHAKDMKGE